MRAQPHGGQQGDGAGVMLLRLFTLGFDPTTERFDDSRVRDFLADKAVEAISDHFFERDGQPWLLLVVRYRLVSGGLTEQAGQATQKTTASKPTKARDESWRELLDKADWPLFNRIREWRGERSRAEGIPPYVVCNNRELAALVKRRPTTLAQIAELDGFGDAKLKKYGAELLAFIAQAGVEPESENGTPSER